MARRFGVSRLSVREATKALSFLGIIRAAPRRGLTLGDVDMARVTQYLGFHFAVADYPKIELLRTRMVIETGALPFVARTMATDASIEPQLWQLANSTRAADAMKDRVRQDMAFHRTLLKASGIAPLLAFDDLLRIFFNRFELEPAEERQEVTLDHHSRIIRHLSQNDVNAARDVLSEHLGYYAPQVDPGSPDVG